MKTKFNRILTLLLVFLVQISFAQDKIISGTIQGESGLPLAGTTVLIKNSFKGVTSNFDGNYSLKAKQGETLVFSYIGYLSKEVVVGDTNTINVTLQEDTAGLEEVVVVAYGSQKKEAVTGAIATVKSETIANQQVTSPLRALQGVIPGVNLITQGGQPGNDPDIRVRGFSSLNADQSPLIVVDGVQFNGNINTISQDQIESITVLKDASSASLYGSRGANGVIVITTKTGQYNTAPKVTVRTQFGISNPSVGIQNRIGTEDHLKLSWQALRNTNQFLGGQSPADAAANATSSLIPYLGGYNPYNVSNPIDTNGNLVAGANLLWETNWEDEVFNEDASRINHNLNISGGNENMSYFFSLDYLNQEGPVIVSDFERIATRLNVESQINNWMKIGIRNSFSRSNSNNPDQTSQSTTQAISWIYGLSSVYPIFARDENGALILDSNDAPIFDLGNGNNRPVGQARNSSRPPRPGEHILASILLGDEQRISTNYVGNAFAEVKLLKGLSFRTTLAYENFVFDAFSFDDDEIGAALEVGGRVIEDITTITTLNTIQAFNYQTRFAKKHNLNVDLITEAFTQTNDRVLASGTGFLPGQTDLRAATATEDVDGNEISERLNSYLARVAYNFNDKYFFEASGRTDGSSRFNRDRRWGYFYSVGGSWIASKENFLKNNATINYLKLRLSHGLLGNNRAGLNGSNFFPAQAVFRSGFPNEGVPGVILEGGANADLTWESTISSNLGIDFSLLKGALSGTIDYYNKESLNLIYNFPLPASSGISSILTNDAKVRNHGLEVALNAQIFNTTNFEWRTGINFSLDRNEITELPQDQFINGPSLWKEGNSIFDFFIREWAGVDPETGFGTWFIDELDTNGNIIGRSTTTNYTRATRYLTGKSSLPDIQGGFTSFFKYKQFDLNLLFNFSFGAYLLNQDYSGLINNFKFSGQAAHPDNLNAWQQPGDITDVPLLLVNNNDHSSVSTRFLQKNDWIRLRALTFGYNLPTGTLKGINKFRLFLQADNLFTWSTLDSTEPEQAFSGTTNNRSPLLKTITAGLTVEF
jgi:TonB-linked SusC/RagA family outer membrane protein